MSFDVTASIETVGKASEASSVELDGANLSSTTWTCNFTFHGVIDRSKVWIKPIEEPACSTILFFEESIVAVVFTDNPSRYPLSLSALWAAVRASSGECVVEGWEGVDECSEDEEEEGLELKPLLELPGVLTSPTSPNDYPPHLTLCRTSLHYKTLPNGGAAQESVLDPHIWRLMTLGTHVTVVMGQEVEYPRHDKKETQKDDVPPREVIHEWPFIATVRTLRHHGGGTGYLQYGACCRMNLRCLPTSPTSYFVICDEQVDCSRNHQRDEEEQEDERIKPRLKGGQSITVRAFCDNLPPLAQTIPNNLTLQVVLKRSYGDNEICSSSDYLAIGVKDVDETSIIAEIVFLQDLSSSPVSYPLSSAAWTLHLFNLLFIGVYLIISFWRLVRN